MCSFSHAEKLEPLPGFYWVNRKCYQFTSETSSSNSQLKDTWIPSQSQLSRPDQKGLCHNGFSITPVASLTPSGQTHSSEPFYLQAP